MRIIYFYNKLANYLPSFMSRYYIQMLLVSIPWILQNSKISLGYISWTFSLFFIGSLTSSIFFSMVVNKLNIAKWMKVSIIIQLITIGLCFSKLNLEVLLFLRFLQGLASGLFRPLNRIWLQDTLNKSATPHESTKIASIGQAFIALGMSSGALAGIGIVVFYSNQFYLSIVILIPAVLALFPLIKSKFSSCHKNNNNVKINEIVRFFKINQSSLIALIIYIISLIVFKIWIIGVPFYFRANMPYDDSLVKQFLIFQALAYAIAQFIIGFLSKKLSNNKYVHLYLMLIATILQGIITWLSLYVKQRILLYLFFIIGGGIIPAAIFPLMMIIFMKDLQKESLSLRNFVFFILAIAADLGQLLGSLLLIKPDLFNINLGVIFIPLIICFAITLYIKMTSLNFNK